MNGEGTTTAPEAGGSVLADDAPPPDGKQPSPTLMRRVDRSAAPIQPTPVRAPMTGGTITAVVALGLVLLGIIAVAFRGSWTAHNDGALAAHFDPTGAALYPFAPDGLIVIALIAAMVLRHNRKARLYAMFVVGLFTFTSFVINHLHGLGQFAINPATGLRPDLPWPVVALIAGQVIGAIYFGSHLIVFALRHLFPGAQADQPVSAAQTAPNESADHADAKGREPSVRVVETVLDPDPEDVAKLVYSVLLDLGQTVGRDKLATACKISGRTAVRVRKAVEQEREEAELQREEEERLAVERKAQAEEAAKAKRPVQALAHQLEQHDRPAPAVNGPEPTDEELTSGMTPAEVLSGPGLTALRRQWRERAAVNRAIEQPSPNGSGPVPAGGAR